MKTRKIIINTFGLPENIQSRIDDLVELHLNTATINLLTTEFSTISNPLRKKIGKYIQELINIEIELEEENAKLNKPIFEDSKREMMLKLKKDNLVRIKQIFSGNNNKILERSKEHNAKMKEHNKSSNFKMGNIVSKRRKGKANESGFLLQRKTLSNNVAQNNQTLNALKDFKKINDQIVSKRIDELRNSSIKNIVNVKANENHTQTEFVKINDSIEKPVKQEKVYSKYAVKTIDASQIDTTTKEMFEKSKGFFDL